MIESNIDPSSFNHVSDQDLIQLLEMLHEGYTENPEGTPEKNAYSELLGAALDAAVKRSEIKKYFKQAAAADPKDEKIKSLNFLVSEQPPTPHNDLNKVWGGVLRFFSEQERKRKR